VSSVTLAPGAVSRPAINPWFVAIAVVVPTFMEVLDTTIANVALRYIAGGLSASNVDSDWVLTSYLAANATILPITGWLSAHLGRRNYFLISIAVFTIASGLCGMATSLEQLILFRVIQGLGGGGLQPSSQAILLDSFPPEKQGAAQTMFGVAALLAPVVGPTLGGYLTVTYNWRWIFYINLPVGAIGFLASYLLVDDPDYLKKERAELRRQPLNFDYIGLGLLTLIMSSWEVMLSKGQEWDWYNDPFWRVQTLFVLFVLGLVILIVRETRIANPVVNFRPLGERNFAACCVIIFCAFGVLYGASTSLPGRLQSLFGYDAYVSGLVQSPSGIFSVMGLFVVGAVIGRGVDARWLIAGGLLVMASGNYWMALMNLYISPGQVIWPRVVLITGLSMIFAPINVAAFKYIPPHLRGAAVGLFSLLRNEGGSVGTSLAPALEWRREHFHTSRVGEFLDPLNPAVKSFLQQGRALFFQQTGDRAASRQLTLQALADLRQQQAVSLAYFDVFWLFAVLALALVPLVFLMKRSVAEKGEHIGAE
jgi:DHA2 family multidrug resistance protein